MRFLCRVLSDDTQTIPCKITGNTAGKNFLKKQKKYLLFFERCANISKSSRARQKQIKNPGVAKFGIALEWGSRGLEFESRHSDQKTVEFIEFHGFFLTFLANLKPCFLFYLPLVYQLMLHTFLPGIRLYCFSVLYQGGHRYLPSSLHRSGQAIPEHLSVTNPLQSKYLHSCVLIRGSECGAGCAFL